MEENINCENCLLEKPLETSIIDIEGYWICSSCLQEMDKEITYTMESYYDPEKRNMSYSIYRNKSGKKTFMFGGISREEAKHYIANPIEAESFNKQLNVGVYVIIFLIVICVIGYFVY